MSDNLKLKTGREVYANRGLIGINAELEVAEGYDGVPDGANFPQEWDDEDYQYWSVEERVELADIMIARWQAFKGKAQQR